MRMQFLALAALLPASLGTAVPRDDAGNKDVVKMEGAWQLVRGSADGEAAPEYVIEHLEVVIKKDQFTFKGVAPLTDKASKLSIRIDTSTTPRCIDLKVEAGSLKGTVLEGIYECRGDDLKLCLYLAGGDRNRPLEFESKAGSKRVLFILKRKKQ